MKHLFILPITVAVLLSTVSCTNIPYVALPPPPTGIRHDPNVFAVGIRPLSKAELIRQQGLANNGDKTAAFNVYEHFRFTENDQTQAMQWLVRAADLGHASAPYLLAQIAVHENDRERAMYWARRARDNGYPNAKALLESLEAE